MYILFKSAMNVAKMISSYKCTTKHYFSLAYTNICINEKIKIDKLLY